MLICEHSMEKGSKWLMAIPPNIKCSYYVPPPLCFLQDVPSYNFSKLSSDIKQCVKLLGHSRCTLVAHDWGGAVAWMVAGRWGADLLNGLVVLGCPHLGVAGTNRSAEQSKRSAYMMAHQVGRGSK